MPLDQTKILDLVIPHTPPTRGLTSKAHTEKKTLQLTRFPAPLRLRSRHRATIPLHTAMCHRTLRHYTNPARNRPRPRHSTLPGRSRYSTQISSILIQL